MGVLEKFSLKGKVALVTGGSGMYGKGITSALAEAGATTITASPFPKEEEALASELRTDGWDVHSAEFDLGDAKSIDALHADLERSFGRVDVLVNCSVVRPMKTCGDPLENWIQSMRVNGTGLFHISRVFAESMKERRKGSIVNISSIQGVVGPDFSLYEGTNMDASPDYFFHKGGMIQLTKYFASRFGPYGVRVNSVSPGGCFNNQPEPFLSRYNARTFLGRMANPEDIKGVIVFLASDASEYVTGENIMLDGGYSAK